LFFVPAASFLDDVSDEAAADAAPSDAPSGASCGDSPSGTPSTDETGQAAAPSKDGSLGIGSLKGDIGHE
jgi:putative iron-dependent peroxidase